MAKKQTQEVTIPPTIELTPFTETLQRSGLELSKAERYAAGYAPLMGEVLAQNDIIKGLNKDNPEHGAIAKRASLDLGKICSRLTAKKTEDKATLLVETRLIDGLFNVAESTARLSQKEADTIANYATTVEAERIAALVVVRKEQLAPFGTDVTYIQLDRLTDEQFTNLLANETLLYNAKKAEAERMELQRLENERKAEELRIEAERLQAERIKAERIEQERVRKELAEKEELLQKEREAHAKEQARKDAELAKERELYAKEQQRLQKERADYIVEQQRLAEIERKKQADILAKQQESARIEREKQQAASAKLQAELQAKKNAEAKIISDKKAAELLALKAPDQTKVRVLYDAIKGITIPDMQSDSGKGIAKLVELRIKNLLLEIAQESKKLL